MLIDKLQAMIGNKITCKFIATLSEPSSYMLKGILVDANEDGIVILNPQDGEKIKIDFLGIDEAIQEIIDPETNIYLYRNTYINNETDVFWNGLDFSDNDELQNKYEEMKNYISTQYGVLSKENINVK